LVANTFRDWNKDWIFGLSDAYYGKWDDTQNQMQGLDVSPIVYDFKSLPPIVLEELKYEILASHHITFDWKS
jgi:hypothetical protein